MGRTQFLIFLKNNMPKEILQWFLNRGVSEEVLLKAGIYFENNKIVYPVKDKEGNVLFSKYRRNPYSEEGPKYTYKKGSSAHLYNIETIKNLKNEIIFITEGENDCLLLNSIGLNAVSSTGGAGTFNPEWFLEMANNDIYIVYDRDEAGMKGALRVNQMQPAAKIIFLPHDTKGKDVTDYFKTHNVRDFEKLVTEAESWVMPRDVTDMPANRSGVEAIVKSYIRALEDLDERRREYVSLGKNEQHIEFMCDKINQRLDTWRSVLDDWKRRKNNESQYGDDLVRAKSTPITQYIKFNSGGFALCLWHDEKHASMKYRPERNKVFCHGCGAHKDVIDVVMQQNNIEFYEAVKKILNK